MRPRDRLMRALRSEPALVAAGAICFGLVGSYPMFGHWRDRVAMSDWDFWIQLQWVAERTIHHYHQVPLWNPWKCGGMPMLGNPQSHLATPWFVLTLLFGPFAGLHMEIPVHLAIAWAGGYVLARVLKIGPLGSLGAATMFASSSWFYLRVGVGQLWAFGFCYLPWMMASVTIASETGGVGYMVGAGAALALALLEAGPYPVAFGVLMLGIVQVVVAIQRRSARPLIVAALAVAFAIGFSAVKLVPAAIVASQHPRPTLEAQINTGEVLKIALFSTTQNIFSGSPNGWGSWEEDAYVGLFAIPALLGLIAWRRAMPWIALAAAMLWLARGDAGTLRLWPILHSMPVFSSLRLPSRFLVIFVLAVAVLAGFGFDFLSEEFGPTGRVAAIAMLVLASVNSMLAGPPTLDAILNVPIQPGPAQAFFSQISRRQDNSQIVPTLENRGVVRCYEYTDWTTTVRASDEPGYRGEYYMIGPGAVRLARWTPNALEFDVDGPPDAVLVVNQNYDLSWRVTSGRGTAFSNDGLLAVRVADGKGKITLRYISVPVIGGAIVTALTIFAAIALVKRNRAGRAEV
ncbi:MAG TPA: hypothetical protein VEU51_05670 [Candidatus Acidoferrales bacterium]|nr:hypothetical protein [Candidatus Acidoferrales bacterium]